MKKAVAIILILTALICIVSCGGKKTPVNGDNSGGNAGDDTKNIKAWAFHGYQKTVVNLEHQGELSTDYKVYLCKGETEGCQVAICFKDERASVMLDMKSGETEAIETSVYSMDRTHKTGRKYYTDALIPYNGRRLIVEANTILPFMIEFKTDKDTPAGEYKYVYEIKDRKDNVYATYNITVHVWDIFIPEDRSFATSAGLNRAWMAQYSNGDSSDEMYKLWHDMEIEHGINTYDLPYDILDDRANEYMSDPRRTSFVVPIPKKADGTVNEEKLLQYYNKIKSNPVWFEKAYFFPIDEPRTIEHLNELKEWHRILSELCPGIGITSPYYTNIPIGGNRDQTDHMAEYMDFWCPKLCLWDDERSYGDFLNYTPDKTYAERMAEQKAKGDKLWAYVCNDPDDPYAQMFIDTEGVHQRLMFWQMYQRDVEGFLYWTTAYYGYDSKGNHVDPWESTNTGIANGDGKTIYGCGFLFYPGKDVGVKGCVPSIRAKIVRDGAEDVELFYLAEKVLGKDWVVEKTKEGTSTVTSFTTDDNFASLRIEIGNALEAAMKK